MFRGRWSTSLTTGERMTAVCGARTIPKEPRSCLPKLNSHQLGAAVRFRTDQATDREGSHCLPVVLVVDPQRITTVQVTPLSVLLRLGLMIAMRHIPTIAGMSDINRMLTPMNQDIKRFVSLRNQMAKIREEIGQTDGTMTPAQRDLVTLAQAEALCDIAATLNGGLTGSSD